MKRIATAAAIAHPAQAGAFSAEVNIALNKPRTEMMCMMMPQMMSMQMPTSAGTLRPDKLHAA
ncbi:MAG: hypothetical protein VKJ06_07560 [Vampirovibrionales bacterium]|nr:hypothetical protein [Vampirovibrionales bacterium]